MTYILLLLFLNFTGYSCTHDTQIGPRWKRYWEDSTITEKGGGKCCGKVLKAAGGVEVVDVIRIRAPKKWVAGTRIQAQSAGGR